MPDIHNLNGEDLLSPMVSKCSVCEENASCDNRWCCYDRVLPLLVFFPCIIPLQPININSSFHEENREHFDQNSDIEGEL